MIFWVYLPRCKGGVPSPLILWFSSVLDNLIFPFFFLYFFSFPLHYSIAKEHFISFLLLFFLRNYAFGRFPFKSTYPFQLCSSLNYTTSFKLYVFWNLSLVFQALIWLVIFENIFRFRVYLMFCGDHKSPLGLPFTHSPFLSSRIFFICFSSLWSLVVGQRWARYMIIMVDHNQEKWDWVKTGFYYLPRL